VIRVRIRGVKYRTKYRNPVNQLTKLVLDDYFAYDRDSRREILYWVRSPQKGKSVVLKGAALEFVPGLEAVCAPS
jgi:hypothetical protein